MPNLETLQIIHALCCAWMIAIILCVQFLIYPTFLKIPFEHFQDHHQKHSQRISFLVIPMFIQWGLAVILFSQTPDALVSRVNLAIAIALFLATAWVVPIHQKLQESMEESSAKKLINTLIRRNWLRTVLWTGQGLFLLHEKLN